MDLNAQHTNNNEDKIANFSRNRTSVTGLQIGQKVIGRIVTGFEVRSVHWWPTLAEDENKTKLSKPTWRTAYVSGDSKTPLDSVAEIDAALQQAFFKTTGGDPTKASSVLKKKAIYLFAWIKRGAEGENKVEVLEANWTVAQGIHELRTKRHPTNPDMLYYGLPYMYDVCIAKEKNPKTGRAMYTVTPFQCKTEGRIPSMYLEEKKNPINNKAEFFSQEDLEAISACDWELKEQYTTITSAELVDRLKDFPIDLSRRIKGTSQFMFFRNIDELTALQAAMAHEGIMHITPAKSDLSGIPAAAINNDFPQKVISGMTTEATPALTQEAPAISPAQNSTAGAVPAAPNFNTPPVGGGTVAPETVQPPVQEQPAPSTPVATVQPGATPVTSPVTQQPSAPTQAVPVAPVAGSVNPGPATANTPGVNPVAQQPAPPQTDPNTLAGKAMSEDPAW